MKDATLQQTAARILVRLVHTLAVLGAGLGAGACSLVVEQSASQCESDADCVGFGAAVCSAEKVCVSALGAPCATNQECVGRLGPDYVCVASESLCKSLRSDQCQTIVGAPASDDALIVGSIGPTGGLDEGIGLPIENAIRVAVSDFKEASAAEKPRPMVVVGCNDDSTPETGVAAATHLVSIGAPAVIGAAFSGITLRVKDVTVPAGTLLISPSATAVGIGALVDNSLVWRTAPPDTYQTQAIALYIDQHLKPQVVGAPPLKLAVLHRGDAYGRDLSKALEEELILNGERPTDASNASCMLKSIYWPPPLPVTRRNALTIVYAANIPAITSASGAPTIVGSPSGKPVTLMMPLTA